MFGFNYKSEAFGYELNAFKTNSACFCNPIFQRTHPCHWQGKHVIDNGCQRQGLVFMQNLSGRTTPSLPLCFGGVWTYPLVLFRRLLCRALLEHFRRMPKLQETWPIKIDLAAIKKNPIHMQPLPIIGRKEVCNCAWFIGVLLNGENLHTKPICCNNLLYQSRK